MFYEYMFLNDCLTGRIAPQYGYRIHDKIDTWKVDCKSVSTVATSYLFTESGDLVASYRDGEFKEYDR